MSARDRGVSAWARAHLSCTSRVCNLPDIKVNPKALMVLAGLTGFRHGFVLSFTSDWP